MIQAGNYDWVNSGITSARFFVKGSGKEEREIRIRVRIPHRIKLTLTKVDQDLFQNLAQLLGDRYFSSFAAEKYLNTTPELGQEKLLTYANELLPATEHNPVLVFHLRPNVRFHDGHVSRNTTSLDARYLDEYPESQGGQPDQIPCPADRLPSV